MNILAVGLIILLAFVLQYFFSYIQMQNFTKNYRKLRSKGRVVIGRKKGLARAGAIVMLAIDSNDKVLEGYAMQGVTVLARFKKFDYFNGIKVGTINVRDCKAINLSKSLTSAVLDGVLNFKTVSRGEEIPIPDSPLVKLTKKLKLI
ncbi:transcriptional regulator GutM [Gemella sp. GH3]|uniref:transcriptional regulator GutM n=1 Tax=unclassified Gemella TaxID=2624949 RepID=UPI0015D09175|nr:MULTISPECIES: transcriptional regulator GutM [unclassified Gemella]MBF0713737.1 transcriptional regulator GutM [Gemella sp. GH3.1]NYS50689.1 transcriptional regulator GutM [Gemella sp. GH3]